MSITSSAVLVELNISVWPAQTVDREVTDKVTADANADANSGRFLKDLTAGSHLRKDIEKFAANCRVKHLRHTIPWSDKGSRLLPTSLFLDYKAFINQVEPEFMGMRAEFLRKYPQLVADAPSRLGKMYKADDYPSVDNVANRFAFRCVFSPLPDAGDFRLDVAIADLEEVKQRYADDYSRRLSEAMREPWDRLHKLLTDMSKKLTDGDDEEKKKRYHDTLVTNAVDLCSLLSKLNVTGDPKLEEARKQLELTMLGADIEVIKESPAVRESMKSKVDAILSKFDW